MLKLFISHAADDSELARRVVVLFSTALTLPATAIRCTSVDGYRLPAGVDTDVQLRREVLDSEAFIGIVSPASISSAYVLFELGARWGAGKNLIPLVAPGVPMSILKGPISGLNALRADSSSQLHQLIEDLGIQLSIAPQSPAVFDRALQDVLQIPISGKGGTIKSIEDHAVVVAGGNVSSLEVHKDHSVVDGLTGTGIALLNVSVARDVTLKVTLPGKETELFRDITAGHVWRFSAWGIPYRMDLTEVSYGKDLVVLEVRKDVNPSS